MAAREGRYEDEGWRVRKDGSRFWASVIVTSIYGPKGELRGFSKVTRDITERKRAEEAARAFNQSERRHATQLEVVSRSWRRSLIPSRTTFARRCALSTASVLP